MSIDEAIDQLERTKKLGITDIVFAFWDPVSFDLEDDPDWPMLADQIEENMDWSRTHDQMTNIISKVREELE